MKARRIINDVELSPTFLNDKNPHKFAYIWSSGMYRSIQAALRTLTPNQIYVKIQNTLLSLDIESTGVWVEKDKIIEIALVKFTPDGKKKSMEEV